MYEAGVELFPERRSTLPVTGHLGGRLSDFRSLRFFGLGGASSNLDRTVYRVKEHALEAGAMVRPGGVVGLGATMQWMTADVGPGVGPRSLESLFAPLDTPGFGTKTDYVVYGGQAELTLYDRDTSPEVGVKLGVVGQRYDDRTSDRYDFTRVSSELQAHLPLGYRNRILALRLRTSHAVGHDGGAPPFYLMETLGGAEHHPRLSRSTASATRATYLFNVEYRWEVWTYLDFVLFYDTGKVFADAERHGSPRPASPATASGSAATRPGGDGAALRPREERRGVRAAHRIGTEISERRTADDDDDPAHARGTGWWPDCLAVTDRCAAAEVLPRRSAARRRRPAPTCWSSQPRSI